MGKWPARFRLEKGGRDGRSMVICGTFTSSECYGFGGLHRIFAALIAYFTLPGGMIMVER